VMFEFPQAVGVDPGLCGLGSVCCGFLLKFCETFVVTKDPLCIRELLAKTLFFFKVLKPRIHEVIRRWFYDTQLTTRWHRGITQSCGWEA
jgi:hypothetical protein